MWQCSLHTLAIRYWEVQNNLSKSCCTWQDSSNALKELGQRASYNYCIVPTICSGGTNGDNAFIFQQKDRSAAATSIPSPAAEHLAQTVRQPHYRHLEERQAPPL